MIELVPPDTKIDFVRHRNLAMIVSSLVILVGVAVIALRGGPNYGIDFVGGSLVQVRIASDTRIDTVRAALATVDLAEGSIQDMGNEGTDYLIRLAMAPGKEEENTKVVVGALQTAFGAENVDVLRIESVGPRVGETLRTRALWAVLFATLAMGVYISIRFEWRFGLGAGVALVHDVLVTIAALAVWNYELDLSIVAALLTIVGFSVNDTVVISDRVRENRRKDRRSALIEIINRSINESLGRTILTTSTALLSVLTLYLLGGEVIHGFAFALLVGFVAGVYSTIYIATPVVLVFEPASAAKRG